MSIEAWLTLAGMLVTVMVALLGTAGGVMGWLYSRQQAMNDREVADLKREVAKLSNRVAHMEGRNEVYRLPDTETETG